MNRLVFELRYLFQSRLAAGALIALLLLTSLAVWCGMRAVAAQEQALERIAAAHEYDLSAVKERYKDGGDAGYAAYYTFHLTTDQPPPLAFLALGQRDLLPYSLRVRLLGLHSQLYESETFNPELALPGRFNFAFVLTYLMPLFVIALLHDWMTAERESGRLRLLMSLPLQGGTLWWQRAGLRFAAVLLALLVPLAVGLSLAGASMDQAAGVILIAVLYTGFWVGLSLFVGALARSSATAAAILLGLFVLLTLLLPTAVNAAITRLIPVGKGVELAMTQRQEVHQGWDRPKSVTFEKFFKTHPEWSDTPPVEGRFHWKWYYAMHQVGDEAVAPQAEQYRENLERRDAWTRRLGLVLPAAATQVALHRLADTDLQAQLAYRDSIGEFHTRLRQYYYPFVFFERPFGAQEFAETPQYVPRKPNGALLVELLATLAVMTFLIGFCTTLAIRNTQPFARTEDE